MMSASKTRMMFRWRVRERDRLAERLHRLLNRPLILEDLHRLATEDAVVDAVDLGERPLAEEALDRVAPADDLPLFEQHQKSSRPRLGDSARRVRRLDASVRPARPV
jgi:hypothetical protein